MSNLVTCSHWQPIVKTNNLQLIVKMKLKTFGLVFLLAIGFMIATTEGNAASNSVKWYSFDEGMALGQSQGKKIFMHFWAEWCRYCYTMEKKTFRNSSVITYLNDNFISIKVNYDTEKRLVSIFKVKGLPDNWLFSKDRKDIKHQPGFIPPEKFLVMLKKI
jgi:thioredoxin-related protein